MMALPQSMAEVKTTLDFVSVSLHHEDDWYLHDLKINIILESVGPHVGDIYDRI